jgi:hypothetical protein
MSSCNPFDARARRACLKQAVAKFHRRVTILAYEIDADLAERGIGGLSSHPKIGDAFRSLGIIVDKALAFEKRAEEFQRQRFQDTGEFEQVGAWTAEDGKQLWERLRQEIEQLPERLYSQAKRLCRLHGKVPNFRGTAAATANELSYRVGQAFAEGRARMQMGGQKWLAAKPKRGEGSDGNTTAEQANNGNDKLAGDAENPPALNTGRKPRGNKPDAEKAIGHYVVERQNYYDSLKPRCQQNDAAAIRQARATFGRNTLVKNLHLSGGTVSSTAAWTKINADLFHGPRDGLATIRHSGQKVGADIAEETAGQARGSVTFDEVIRHETIDLIRKANMPAAAAEQFVNQLTAGDIDDDDAREMLESYGEGETSHQADLAAAHKPRRNGPISHR